ncbi:DMT family transporter [Variovorax saccharolyticus]|uniref:DMT family transporter n=1 Tax=Variovorax saccharolyticus TaxID=3053516 RepID=UPI00336A0DCA
MNLLNAPSSPGPAASSSNAPGQLDTRAMGVMTLLCLVWSLQQISLKAVADQASPMLMVALRSAVALVLLALLMRRRGEAPGPGRWKPGLAVGALFGLEYLLVAEALRLTGASHVVVFLYTAPIFAALGLHMRLPAERLGGQQVAGIAVAFGGIALAFLGGDAASSADARSPALLGDGLALLAGAAWGATTVTIRCSSLTSAPATETLLYQLLGAFILLLPAAWLTGQFRFESSAVVWAHLGFQSIVVSFASFLAWCWLLRRYLASRLGVFSFLTPLFGVILGVALLGEAPEPAFIAGSVLVLVGIGLVSARCRVGPRFKAAGAFMARTSEWAAKVLTLIRGGNTDAAIAQIKVAPSVKDIRALEAALAQAGLAGRWRDVDQTIAQSIDALSAPRLHRSP